MVASEARVVGQLAPGLGLLEAAMATVESLGDEMVVVGQVEVAMGAAEAAGGAMVVAAAVGEAMAGRMVGKAGPQV